MAASGEPRCPPVGRNRWPLTAECSRVSMTWQRVRLRRVDRGHLRRTREGDWCLCTHAAVRSRDACDARPERAFEARTRRRSPDGRKPGCQCADMVALVRFLQKSVVCREFRRLLGAVRRRHERVSGASACRADRSPTPPG